MTLLDTRLQRYITILKPQGALVIWGCGQLGHAVYQSLSAAFPDLEVAGFIDSSVSHETSIDGVIVYPPDFLTVLDPSLIIIASIAFEEDICALIASRFAKFENKIITLTSSKDHKISLNINADSKDSQYLHDMVFEYPDSIEVWDILLGLSSCLEDELLFRGCTKMLRGSE